MHDFSEKRPLKIKRIKEFLRGFNGNNILDVGCGFSPISIEVIEGNIIGLDILPDRLKIARELGLNVVLSDLNDGIPFKDEMFDLIIATGYIPCLIYDTDYLLDELWRVLKPSGTMVIDVYNICSLNNRIRTLLGMLPFGVEYAKESLDGKERIGFIRAFNKDIFIALLKKHRFVIEDIRTNVIRIPKIVRIPWKYRYFVSLGEDIIVKCCKDQFFKLIRKEEV